MTLPEKLVIEKSEFEEDHSPPAGELTTVSGNIPTQTNTLPDIAGETVESTRIKNLATETPQELVALYFIVSTPEDSPETIPADTIVAIDVNELLHAPPVTDSDNVVWVLKHIDESPVIAPASGNVFMVMGSVAVAVPHVLFTAYLIVSNPAAIPVTTPPEMDARPLAALHKPVEIVSDKVMWAPVQTLSEPVIKPESGKGLTVIV
jgi:hypothetical protein